MAAQDTLPRFSYDLIQWLSDNIEPAEVPQTIQGWAKLSNEETRMRLAFKAGARSLVDQLVMWQQEEEAEASDDGQPEGEPASISDGPELRFPDVFDPLGNVRQVVTPASMARNSS
ncbi:MAG: hypothetical protein GEU78_07930 [Actinobacteria bacterium]|nr:hypothetical protein [Actinomycetota bacterium]